MGKVYPREKNAVSRKIIYYRITHVIIAIKSYLWEEATSINVFDIFMYTDWLVTCNGLNFNKLTNGNKSIEYGQSGSCTYGIIKMKQFQFTKDYTNQLNTHLLSNCMLFPPHIYKSMSTSSFTTMFNVNIRSPASWNTLPDKCMCRSHNKNGSEMLDECNQSLKSNSWTLERKHVILVPFVK